MSSQGQANIPTVEYSLKSLSWHAKTISEGIAKSNTLKEQMIALLEHLIKSGQAKQLSQSASSNKILHDECPF